MAVTISVPPRLLDFAKDSSVLNGGTYSTSSFSSGTETLTYGSVAINDVANLSSACKITKISISIDCQCYKGSAYNAMYVEFKVCPLASKGTNYYRDYISSGEERYSLGKRYCDVEDYRTCSGEYDVSSYNCGIHKAEGYGFGIIGTSGGWTTIDRKARIRNFKVGYTRTRACYITFKGDNVTEKTTTYDYGTTPSFGSTPTRDGYKFVGWQSSAGGIYSGTLPTAYEQDVTYTAVWAVNTPYTVNFNGNGATSGSIASLSKNAGESFSLPENTFEKKYAVVFNHNYSGASNSVEISSATFQGWEDHGSITAHTGVTYDYTQFDAPFYANKYADLYKAFGYNKRSLVNHYVDNGKSEGRQCTGSPRGVYPSKATVVSIADDSGSTTLYAQWSAMPEITFPSPQRTGYVFLGWYTTPNGGTKVGNAGAKYTPTGNTTFFAHWEAIGLYVGSAAYDVYQGTTKLEIYQGTTKIHG